jgi:hypothetical protein
MDELRRLVKRLPKDRQHRSPKNASTVSLGLSMRKKNGKLTTIWRNLLRKLVVASKVHGAWRVPPTRKSSRSASFVARIASTGTSTGAAGVGGREVPRLKSPAPPRSSQRDVRSFHSSTPLLALALLDVGVEVEGSTGTAGQI